MRQLCFCSKNCIEQQELVTRHNKHDITAFHSQIWHETITEIDKQISLSSALVWMDRRNE